MQLCVRCGVCAGTAATPKQPSLLLLSEVFPPLALALYRKFCIKGSGKHFQQACCRQLCKGLSESAIREASETAVQRIPRWCHSDILHEQGCMRACLASFGHWAV